MRIGIDLQVLGQKPLTGVGKYVYHLAETLKKLDTDYEFVFFAPEIPVILKEVKDLVRSFGAPQDDKIILLPEKRIPFWSAHVNYARIMQKARLDVLHGPANVLPWVYTSPFTLSLPRRGKGRGRTVVTLHDLAIYRHPEWFPGGQWFSTKFLVPRSIKKADAIIVPSEVTANDVAELFRVPDQKIHVVPHGVEEKFFSTPVILNGAKRSEESRSFGAKAPQDDKRGVVCPPGKYILFVGTLEPRKNVERLIQAYQLLPEDIRAEYELWIAGVTTSYISPSPPLAEGGERQGVKFLGYVPDEGLPALYQNASIFAYPSLYEGFGLPVLEAMAAGVPVVTSILTPAPSPFEGEGDRRADEGVLRVNPYSTGEIRDAILKLIRDSAYSSQISAAGVRRARDFTWEKTALETLRVYESL